MTKANGTERGWAPVIVVLVAAILMLVLMTRLATFGGTAALTIEDRWRQAQARRAAENALVRWHRDLREEAVPAIREALGRVAGDPGRYDPRSQVLTGLRFAPIRASYDATPLDGEMRPVGRHVVEVEARVALGGPPEVTNLAGVSAEGRSGAEETYTFLVHATARSRVSEPEGGRTASHTLRDVTAVKVTILTRYAIDPGVLAGLKDTGPRAGRVGGRGMGDERPREARGFWDLVPPAYADSEEYFAVQAVDEVMPHVRTTGGPPSGGWSGAPEIVSGPTEVGYSNGNTAYYWYLKGVPTGSRVVVVEGPATAEIMAYDDWRFHEAYNRGTDMAPLWAPDRPSVMRWGSPRYAVVVVRAKPAYEQPVLKEPIEVKLTTPGGEITLAPLSTWEARTADMRGPTGNPYTVVGMPGGAEGALTPWGAIIENNNNPPISSYGGTLTAVESNRRVLLAGSSVVNVEIHDYDRQNPQGPFSRMTVVNGRLLLLSGASVRASVLVSVSSSTFNSVADRPTDNGHTHWGVPPPQIGGDVPNCEDCGPPPPCPGCDPPPPPVSIFAVMVVPLHTWSVPDPTAVAGGK